MPIQQIAGGGWQWGEHTTKDHTGDTHAAAGIALRSPQGRLLFLKRSDRGDHPGEWCFPGGGVEAGEDPITAALRETREEVGLVYTAGVAPIDMRNGFTTYTSEVEKEFTPTLNEEHTAYAWAAPWNAPEPLHPGVKETLSMSDHRRTHDAEMLDFAGYYAPEKIQGTEKRVITPEGFMIIQGNPIARTGEQLYNGREINKDVPEDDPKYIKPNGAGFILVERLDEEVFHPETLASFEGKDLTIEHPPEGVDITNWKKMTVGHIQNVRRGTGIEDDLVLADLIVKDPMAIEHINKYLPEISAGYRADYEPVEPGRAIQRNIIGNHVAGVKAGRAGARVSIRDQDITASIERVRTYIGEYDMPNKTPMLRAVLAAVGIKTEDAAKIETALSAVDTTDSAAGSENETEKKMKEISNDMKSVKDWMAARDAEREEEKKIAKEALDKKTRDAEEKKEEESARTKEFGEKEATGDTIIEAEGSGGVMNLGKTWKGSMTGDSAMEEPVLSAINARAEILAPGAPKITTDSIKGTQGRALAAHLRYVLTQHSTSPQGRSNVQQFLTGDSIESLKGSKLVGVFNGAAALARAKNNQLALVARRVTTDGATKGPRTAAEINAANREHWAKNKTAS